MIGILTGNATEDRAEYLRLSRHEISFAERALQDERAALAAAALRCAERYLANAAALKRTTLAAVAMLPPPVDGDVITTKGALS